MFYARGTSSRERPAQLSRARGKQPRTCSSRGSPRVPAAPACGDGRGARLIGSVGSEQLFAACVCSSCPSSAQLPGPSAPASVDEPLQGSPSQAAACWSLLSPREGGCSLRLILWEKRSGSVRVVFPPDPRRCHFPSQTAIFTKEKLV